MSDMNSIEYFKENYKAISDHYKNFTDDVSDLIKKILHSRGISYDAIQSRVKSLESSVSKLTSKQYENGFLGMLDLSGIRVIAQTQVEVKEIIEALGNEFIKDKVNSVNKNEQFKDNEFGYNSVHLILSINESRLQLLEYSSYDDMKCEVQVRTILEHAWASLSHDRAYKFNQVLPRDINREMLRLAAMLEQVDQSFVDVSKRIDVYAANIGKDIKEQKYIEINSLSLYSLLDEITKDIDFKDRDFNKGEAGVILEMNGFGIHNIEQVKELLNQDKIIKVSKTLGEKSNYLGFLRRAMLFSDTKKFVKNGYNGNYKFREEEIDKLVELGLNLELIPEHMIMS